MQTAEAVIFANITRARIAPPRITIDSMTSGTPCPLASRARWYTIGPMISPPTAGANSL
jgi:hypothetical protein